MREKNDFFNYLSNIWGLVTINFFVSLENSELLRVQWKFYSTGKEAVDALFES